MTHMCQFISGNVDAARAAAMRLICVNLYRGAAHMRRILPPKRKRKKIY
ncbi:MAG TPA: hypothetical protein PLI57_11675 [Spirochaetota bacterium]|nr:hypothetical protein [Spirochaetota bacterium]